MRTYLHLHSVVQDFSTIKDHTVIAVTCN